MIATSDAVSTTPYGHMFVSYRRKRADDIRRLVLRLHDLGVPTWQDVTDLDEEHTEEEIRRVLALPETAGAILWLTPDVADSDMIRRVEIPWIVRRHERNDGFFIVPIAAGGLDYAGAARVAGNDLGVTDLEEWNIRRTAGKDLTDAEVVAFARRALRRRMKKIHTVLDAEAPITLTLNTRVPAGTKSDAALQLNWTGRFDGREALTGAWDQDLLPALTTIFDDLERYLPGRPVLAGGLLNIPAAFALGAAALAPRGRTLQWRQYTLGQPGLVWSLEASPEDPGFTVIPSGKDVGANDLAVLISVTESVEPAFAATTGHPPYRAVVEIGPSDENYPHRIVTPSQAGHLANQIVAAIRSARTTYLSGGTIHIFFAGPVGLAVLIGQLMNTLGRIQTYEHIPDGAVGHYRKAALLHPGR